VKKATTMTKGKTNSTNGKTSSKKATSSVKKGEEGKSPAARISERIEELGDWRGETLA